MSTPNLIKTLKAAWLQTPRQWGLPELNAHWDADTLLIELRENNLDLLFLKLATEAELDDNLTVALLPKLITAYRVEKGAQLLIDAEIARVARAVAAFPCLFLKGRVLATQLGLDLYKRSGDIDLLFYKSDLRKVIPVFQRLGYKLIFSEANGEFSMQNAAGLIVDVHYNLSASSTFICVSRLRVHEWFSDATGVEVGAQRVPTLSITRTFTHLCLHFAVNHRFNDYLLLFELVQYLRCYGAQLDRAWITAYAAKHRFNVLVYLTLRLITSHAPDLLDANWLTALGANAALRSRAEHFLAEHNLVAAILLPQDNDLEVNDVPKLCADTFYKKVLYQQGIQYWNFKVFDRSFKAAFK